MALTRAKNGQYVIKTKAEAERALVMMHNLQGEITALMEEHGIAEMQMDATELKRAATVYLASKEIETIKLPKIGKYGRMIRAVNRKFWIGTKDEIPPDSDEGVKALRSLVPKEVWLKITKRVPDPALIDEAVAEGLITAKQIEPAYVETFKAPYLNLYNEGEE